MGVTSSKSENKTLNEIAIDVVQSTVNNCMTTATQDQILQVDYVVGDVDISGTNFSQAMSVDVNCMMTDTKQSEISSLLANAIEQYADAQSKGLLVPPGGTNAEAINEIENKIKTGLKQENIQNSITAVSQNQKIKYGYVGRNFVGKNLTMSQTASLIAESIVNTSAVQTVINDVENKVKQATKSESTGAETSIVQAFTGIFGNIATGVIAVVLIIGILAVVLYFGFGGKKDVGSDIATLSTLFSKPRSRRRHRS